MSAGAFRLALTGQALIEQPVAVRTPAAAELAADLSGAHMAAANFEGTLGAPHAWPVKMKTLHIAAPQALASLRSLGINVLGLANNHAFDLGQPGVMATRAGALAAGFTVAGSGENIAAAGAAGIVTSDSVKAALLAFDLGPQADMVYAGESRPGINPLRIRKELALPADELARLAAIARACGHEARMARRVAVGYSDALAGDSMDFFGVTVRPGARIEELRYPDPADLERALDAVTSARTSSGRVVVSLHNHHWEVDWAEAPAWLATLCAALVDAGADAVACHGPPVLQGMAFHRGRPIFYGLGNFIFHTARSPRYDQNGIDVWRSVVATCDYAADGALASVRIRPIRVGLPPDKTPAAEQAQAPEYLDGTPAREVMARFLDRSTLGDATVSITGTACIIHPQALA